VKNLAILGLVVFQEILELLVHQGHHLVVVVVEEVGVGRLHLLVVAELARYFGEYRPVGRPGRGLGRPRRR